MDVAAGLEGRSRGDVTRDVEQALQGIALPLAYHAEVLAPEEETPTGQLIALGVAAAIGVLLLLQVSFGSWGLGVVGFVLLPLSLAGGALGALAAGGDLGLGSLIGFAAVLGIAARNTVLLITRFQQLEREEGEAFGPQLILRGAGERVGPILVTAIATLWPSCRSSLSAAGAGYELLHPMAAVVIGGLVTSTLIALLVVPALYSAARLGRRRRRGAGGGISATCGAAPAACPGASEDGGQGRRRRYPARIKAREMGATDAKPARREGRTMQRRNRWWHSPWSSRRCRSRPVAAARRATREAATNRP